MRRGRQAIDQLPQHGDRDAKNHSIFGRIEQDVAKA
jgi:hypothetical protein